MMVMRPGRFVECPPPSPPILGGRGRGGPRCRPLAAPGVATRSLAPRRAPERAPLWKPAGAPALAARVVAGEACARPASSGAGEVADVAAAARAATAATADEEGAAPTCRPSPSPTPSSGYHSDISFEWSDEEEGADDADDEESSPRTPSPFGVPSWDVREVTVSERWGGLAITPGFSIWSPTVEDEPLLAANGGVGGAARAPTPPPTAPCLPEAVPEAAPDVDVVGVPPAPPSAACWAEVELGLYPDRDPAGPRQAVVRAANQCGPWGVFGAWHPMPTEDEAAALAEITLREEEEIRARAAVKKAERLARYGRKVWWVGRHRRHPAADPDCGKTYEYGRYDCYDSRNL